MSPEVDSPVGDRTVSPEHRSEDLRRGPKVSFAGKVTAGFLLILILVAGIAALASRSPLSPWGIFLLVLLTALPLGTWLIARLLRPIDRILEDLSDGIRSFRDRDFSVRLQSRRVDEFGHIVHLYNEVGAVLQSERRDIRERELLLQAALNQSPVAILLVNQLDRIIYSNHEARRLLMGGAKLEGKGYSELRAGLPEEMKQILAGETDSLFSVQADEVVETYHLSQRVFQLNRRSHRLVLLRRMTGDLGRQEAAIWKRVIRVISHELNNSLAPISSLLHSARIVAREPRHADRADEIYSTMEERLDHLSRFIEGYAQFARLPTPQYEEVDWHEFLGRFSDFPQLVVAGSPPARPGYFDPAQIQQVLVNLFKNAAEASDHLQEIKVRVDSSRGGGTYIQVLDRGRGMDEETLRKSLLPFYSTKQTGSGLGLPLCREILEAHGGKLSLHLRPQGGTAVTCWLPSKSTESQQEASASQASSLLT
jgi:two-component system nitrogen regulation sensor histidine kinase NtrY